MPEKPVIRLRLKDIGIPNDEQVDILKGIEYKLLRSFKLKGVPNIKKVNNILNRYSWKKIKLNFYKMMEVFIVLMNGFWKLIDLILKQFW